MGRTVSDASGYAPEEEKFDPEIEDFVSKERRYLHFDLPISEAGRTGLTYTADEICSHSFWPLLAYESVERRAKKDESGETVFEEKARPIKFAAHTDAALLEWYTQALSLDYETFLSNEPFAGSVLAYRAGIGDNIAHAKALFDEIRHRGDCTAIAVDVSGFFDNIRHDVLASCLRRLLSADRLPDHHYKIFRCMTGFSWVDSDALRARLGAEYGKRGRICNAKQFREIVRSKSSSLVRQNRREAGIPQGTPLSGLYANISMMDVDKALYDLTSKLRGSYRRYSDDIAVVIPGAVEPDELIDQISQVLSTAALELSAHKTETSSFSLVDGQQSADRPFQYLGFTFDGKRKLVRQSSLNRYYSKMHNGIRAKVRAAKSQDVPRNEIFLRELYRRYTHFGKARNFPRYAYRASRILEAPEIRNQMRNHMVIFRKALQHYLDRAYE